MKAEKINSKKFEQIDSTQMTKIMGGDRETSWRNNNDGSITYDSFAYWSNADGTAATCGSGAGIMDGFILGPTIGRDR